jgi:hypothetical protein
MVQDSSAPTGAPSRGSQVLGAARPRNRGGQADVVVTPAGALRGRLLDVGMRIPHPYVQQSHVQLAPRLCHRVGVATSWARP